MRITLVITEGRYTAWLKPEAVERYHTKLLERGEDSTIVYNVLLRGDNVR